MKDKKKLLIGILSVLVCIMAVGYALLAQELTINGRASIDSTWRVEITNIASKDIVGDAVNRTAPTYTATTANFSVGFTQPGDSITYDITVTNKGTLDAVVSGINVVTNDNSAIVYTTSGLHQGDKISKNNGTNILTVKVDYDSNVTSQPASTTSDITVTINYQQDLGQISPYEYVVGDKLTFNNSNWYVIKNSTYSEDYVTLMKETVLTNSELGEYAYDGTYDAMDYTWTDTCHSSGNRYYSSFSNNNCNGTNNYDSSKVKEMLETRYLPTIGESNLKEVDGYKIRIISLQDLQENLGVATTMTGTYYAVDAINTPSFVYNNFGGMFRHNSSYWTMTPYYDNGPSSQILQVTSDGKIYNDCAYCHNGHGVRPVINLLKNAIQ